MSSRRSVARLASAVVLSLAGSAQAAPVLVMDGHGRVRARHDRFLPPPDPALADHATGARVARAARSTAATPAALSALLSSGRIDQATYDRARADYDRTVQLTGKLTGGRLVAVGGVLADLEGMARRGELVPERLPALLATLEANNTWWTTGPLLAPGARVEFARSGIVWQHYSGHGIQIQWLGTFGRANALWSAGGHDAELADLLAQSVALGGRRGGGLAFEYLFPFDGGRPPWVSGLAQGTALTALVHGGTRLNDPRWPAAARSALGIFRTPAPEGVAEPTLAGTHYLQYSFAPRLHVLNGFVQSLNGLFDYATVLRDGEGARLFAAGRAEAAAELPAYDTGGWSRYSEYRDSDLAYHDLLRGFLSGLCRRLAGSGQPGEPFCSYAARFAADLVRGPVLTLGYPTRAAHARALSRVRFAIDKPATVTMLVYGRRFAHRAVVAVGSGPHAFGWRPPRPGRYTVLLGARDLAGNAGSISSVALVRR